MIILISLLKFSHHKNTETRYLVIISSYRARSSEPQVSVRGYLIVASEVGLLSEIDRYSCDEVVSGTVTIPSMN